MSKDILYLNSNIKNCEYVYSGISFNDFIKSLNNKFENIVLLKADYIGNSFRRNFWRYRKYYKIGKRRHIWRFFFCRLFKKW